MAVVTNTPEDINDPVVNKNVGYIFDGIARNFRDNPYNSPANLAAASVDPLVFAYHTSIQLEMGTYR